MDEPVCPVQRDALNWVAEFEVPLEKAMYDGKCHAVRLHKRPTKSDPRVSDRKSSDERGAHGPRTPISDSVTECELVPPTEMCPTRARFAVSASGVEQFRTEIPFQLVVYVPAARFGGGAWRDTDGAE